MDSITSLVIPEPGAVLDGTPVPVFRDNRQAVAEEMWLMGKSLNEIGAKSSGINENVKRVEQRIARLERDYLDAFAQSGPEWHKVHKLRLLAQSQLRYKKIADMLLDDATLAVSKEVNDCMKQMRMEAQLQLEVVNDLQIPEKKNELGLDKAFEEFMNDFVKTKAELGQNVMVQVIEDTELNADALRKATFTNSSKLDFLDGDDD